MEQTMSSLTHHEKITVLIWQSAVYRAAEQPHRHIAIWSGAVDQYMDAMLAAVEAQEFDDAMLYSEAAYLAIAVRSYPHTIYEEIV
jgi:sulfur transfer complex TusBCD TusB component (DsrH family)